MFQNVNGGRRRASIALLDSALADAEAEVARREAAARAAREAEEALSAKMLDPALVEEQFENLTESLAETAALLEELMGMKVVALPRNCMPPGTAAAPCVPCTAETVL